MKKEFLEAVKNHTVYRRDNMVDQLAGAIRRSLDPFLANQVEERRDPFLSAPLSSAVSRVGVLYPNAGARQMAAHGNPNFGARHRSTAAAAAGPGAGAARAGGARPFSSHDSPILKLRKQGHGRSKGEVTTAGRSSAGDLPPGESKPQGGQQASGPGRQDGRRLTQTTTQDLASSTQQYQSAGGAPPSPRQLQRIQESHQ